MKFSIRTLDQKTYDVELDDTKLVLNLKEILEKMPEIAMPIDSMQLIYAGRVMQDQDPITNYAVQENKLIVLMRKKLPAVDIKTESKADVNGKTPKKAAPAKPIIEESKVPNKQTTSAAASDLDIESPSVKPNEQQVSNLVSMGYDENDVRAALRASFNHPERAIEYLINGLPPELSVETSPHDSSGIGTPDGTEANVSRWSLLADDPRFERVRALINSHPELLATVLQRLGELDDQTYESITNNQDELISLLNTNNGDADSHINLTESNSDDAFTVQLTSEDVAAVDRLTSLGFSRDEVIQVYLACEKNEEVTADILFRQYEERE